MKEIFLLIVLYIYNTILIKCNSPEEKQVVEPIRCTKKIINDISGYLIDLDGTIYLDNVLIKDAHLFHKALIHLDLPYLYLSNCFRRKAAVTNKLKKLNYIKQNVSQDWEDKHVYTAYHAVIQYLRDNFKYKPANMLIITTTYHESSCGNDNMLRLIYETVPKDERESWQLRMDLSSDEVLQWSYSSVHGKAQTVVVFAIMGKPSDPFGGKTNNTKVNNFRQLIDPVHGFERSAYGDITGHLLDKILILVRNNGIFLNGGNDMFEIKTKNTHYPDLDLKTLNVGTYAKLIQSSAQLDFDDENMKKRFVSTGKGGSESKTYMIEKSINLLEKQNKSFIKSNIAMVGDNMYTDILSAHYAGIKSILVLSGEAKIEEVKYFDYQPTCYVDDVSELTDLLLE